MLISSCSLKVCLVSEYKPVRHRVVEDMHVACSDHIVEEVEVALTILKLTGTDRRAGGQMGRRADATQVSIGMHAHPKMQKV